MRSSLVRQGVLAFLLGMALVIGLARPSPAYEWSVRQLLTQYSCDWVREQRRTHTDAELEAKAKELNLPWAVIRAAKRCKR